MLMLMLIAAVMAMTLIMGSYILSMGIILNREKKYEQVQQQEKQVNVNVRGAADDSSIHIEESSEGRGRPDPTPSSLTSSSNSHYLTMYGSHRVQSSMSRLPKWLHDYFKWHRHETQHKSKETKYIILPCLGSDKCGGFSDRLRTLPFFLLIASRTNRVLCIHWHEPFRLEDFFEPPPPPPPGTSSSAITSASPEDSGGVDWRCPAEYIESVKDVRISGGQKNRHLMSFGIRKVPVVESAELAIKDMNESFNEDTYISVAMYSNSLEKMNEALMLFQRHSYRDKMPTLSHWDHVELMGDIFRVLFQPKEEVAKRVNQTMTKLGLVENNYNSVHIRARYPAHELTRLIGDSAADQADLKGGLHFEGKVKDYLVSLLQNSLSCINFLSPDQTVYFASDQNDFTNYAISHDVGVNSGISAKPVGLDRGEILHSAGANNVNRTADDYYPIIEDLLIMGGSKCVAYGIGSFGAFGAALAGKNCRVIHRKFNGKSVECPNDRGDRTGLVIEEKEMIFGIKDKDGTIDYGQDQIGINYYLSKV